MSRKFIQREVENINYDLISRLTHNMTLYDVDDEKLKKYSGELVSSNDLDRIISRTCQILTNEIPDYYIISNEIGTIQIIIVYPFSLDEAKEFAKEFNHIWEQEYGYNFSIKAKFHNRFKARRALELYEEVIKNPLLGRKIEIFENIFEMD